MSVTKANENVIQIPNVWKIFENFLSVMGPTYVDHCIRTSYFMLKLCEKEQLDPATTNLLVFTAYYHDIGAIGKKPVYLLGADYDLAHSVDGYMLFKYKSPLKDASRVILYHHCSFERQIDDPYYPLGLKIAVCDRFDDWSRHNMDFDKVVGHIVAQKGKAFCPEDVDALLAVIRDNDVTADIQTGKYKEILRDYINAIPYTEKDIDDFTTMLSALFELFHDTTYNHSKSVATIADLLGGFAGYSAEERFHMYFAGLVHDFGKIQIPLSIIDKPGKLTPEEYEVMKTHVSHTKALIDGLLPQDIVGMAVNHHERADGSGYPRRLKSSEFCEKDEILQVADVVSALLSRRSYKEEFPYEKVRDLLLSDVEKGKMSQKVVDVFICNHKAVCAAANEVILEGYREAEQMKKEGAELLERIKSSRFYRGNLPLSTFVDRI